MPARAMPTLNGLNVLRFVIALAEAVLAITLLVHTETHTTKEGGFLHRESNQAVNPSSKALWSRVQQASCLPGARVGTGFASSLADQFYGTITLGYTVDPAACIPLGLSEGSDARLARKWFHDGGGRSTGAATPATGDFDAYCAGAGADALACSLGRDVVVEYGASLLPSVVAEVGVANTLLGRAPTAPSLWPPWDADLGDAWPLQSVTPALMCLTALWIVASFSVFTFNTGMLSVNVWAAVAWNAVGAAYVASRAAGTFHAALDCRQLCVAMLGLAATVQTVVWLSRAGVNTRLQSNGAKGQRSNVETLSIFVGPVRSSETVGHCIAQTFVGLAISMPLVSSAILAASGATSSLFLRVNFALVHVFFLTLAATEYIAYAAQQVKGDAQPSTVPVQYLDTTVQVSKRFVLQSGFGAVLTKRKPARKAPSGDDDDDASAGSQTELSGSEDSGDVDVELRPPSDVDNKLMLRGVGASVYVLYATYAIASTSAIAVLTLCAILFHGYLEMGTIVWYTFNGVMPEQHDARWVIYFYVGLCVLAAVFALFTLDVQAPAADPFSKKALQRRKRRRRVYSYAVTVLCAALTAVPMALLAFDPARLSVGFSGSIPGVAAQ